MREPATTFGLRTRVVRGGDMEAWRAPWADLAARCLEPDIFLSPQFALAAVRGLDEENTTRFALAFRDNPGLGPSLLGVLPIRRSNLRHVGVIDSWHHFEGCPAGLMLDREEAAEALSALMERLAADAPRAAALLLRDLPADGPTASLVGRHARASGTSTVLHASRKRAVFDPRASEGAQALQGLTTHRRKRLRQQARRLERLGELRYEIGTDLDRSAAGEAFLRLEAAGWKGRNGGALLGTPKRAEFARDILSDLPAGACRIDALRLGDRPIAMGIVLRHRDRAWLWKIAYDEALAAASPGVQFIFGFMRAQAGDPTVAWTDSCAVPDHAMIERLWPQRLETQDLMIALPGRADGLRRAVHLIQVVRRLRETVSALRARSLRPQRAEGGG